MTFNSIAFVVFFAVFFFLYWCCRGRYSTRVQNILLMGGSMMFYAWYDWRFLGLIYLAIVCTFVTAILAEKGCRRLFTAVNIAINLAVLVAFKYFNFFGENLGRLFHLLGMQLDMVTVEVLLPVGISFYTFQCIGYSVDVCRRKVRAERDFVDFAVFVSYFPQLVAGPIERASQLLPRIKNARVFDYAGIVGGMRQALWGMLKKVVVADACAPHVEKAFSWVDGAPPSMAWALLGTLLFSVQIYCDFSGYCDMARGVSRCLGIDLTQNFRYPYFSRNVKDFWNRWNISLMAWFREYVYFPLGGSRRGLARTCANVMVVFALSGLWHGANWNFVLWGLYWGVVMVVFRLARSFRGADAAPRHRSAAIVSTCALAVAGWCMFRCSSLSQTLVMLRLLLPGLAVLSVAAWLALVVASRLVRTALYHRWRLVLLCTGLVFIALVAVLFPVPVAHGLLFGYIALVFVVEWRQRYLDYCLASMPSHRLLRLLCYWGMVVLLLVNYMEDVPFIYFKF